MTTRRALLASSAALLLLPLPAWAIEGTAHGYVRFTNLGTGEVAGGDATKSGEKDPSGVDDTWFEMEGFEFGPKRDVAAGARSSGTTHEDRVRAIIPAGPGTKLLQTWSDNKADVRCEVRLFKGGETCHFGAESSGRLAGVKIINAVEADNTNSTGVAAEAMVELSYAFHTLTIDDTVKSKAAEWSWSSRE